MHQITRTRISTRLGALLLLLLLCCSIISALHAVLNPGSADRALEASSTHDPEAPSDVVLASSFTSPSATLTPEQEDFVDWAYSRYERAGLEVAEVTITFHETSADCYGFGGVYIPSTRSVRVCQMVKATIIHELAHAWLESATFGEADRESFMAHRGLESWADSSSEWNQRGAEQAAEVLTWGLMDRNIQIRWFDTSSDGGESDGEAKVSYRLFKIPDSGPDQLAAAYQLLTGNVPTDRLDDDPRHVEEVLTISPEARR